MRRVDKQTEPALLKQERQDGNSFAKLRKECRQAMQRALCIEQGYLCCFCESSIEPSGDSMKMAHFVPQSVDRSKSLDWTNLYGACLGNQPRCKGPLYDTESPEPDAREYKGLHCDAKQGQHVLDDRLRPDRLSDGLIRYKPDGTLDSPDPHICNDLVVKLNLNHRRLKENRVAVLDSLMESADYDPARARGLICRVPNGQGRLTEFVSFLLAMVG